MSRYDSPSLPFRARRRSGCSLALQLKGYALVEYETMAEAQAAIDSAPGSTLLEQTVQCDYAFIRPPPSGPRKGRVRGRSASPSQKKTRDDAN